MHITMVKTHHFKYDAMKTWIRNHISDLNEELKLINKEVTRLIKRRSLLKRKINMFNKVMNNTDETE